MIGNLRPAVPRHVLFGIAGLFWTCAGMLLCIRGAALLRDLQTGTALLLESASVTIACAAYVFGFYRMVRKNINRILRLPARACVFAFTAWYGYVIIGLMITTGVALRQTIPGLFLAGPYTAMGVVLLIGSIGFYREFLHVAQWRRSSML